MLKPVIFFIGLYNNEKYLFNEDYIVTLYILKPDGDFINIELTPKVNLKNITAI